MNAKHSCLMLGFVLWQAAICCAAVEVAAVPELDNQAPTAHQKKPVRTVQRKQKSDVDNSVHPRPQNKAADSQLPAPSAPSESSPLQVSNVRG